MDLLCSGENTNGWTSSIDSCQDFTFPSVCGLNSTTEKNDQSDTQFKDGVNQLFFTDQELLPESQEDEYVSDDEAYVSDDEAIFTKEVAWGDGYNADCSDSELNLGESKKPKNRQISSFSDSESGMETSDKVYCYRKQRPEAFSMNVSEMDVPNPVESAMRSFCSNRSVPMFKPELGMSFISPAEGYQFYNLYSWVLGFSIRNGDSYQNKKGERTMQEFKCQREGITKNAKKSTTRCGCKAMLKITLSPSGQWFVRSFVETHNHDLVESCAEKKHLFSHKHIDPETKSMVKHLRENNVSLTKVNTILSGLFSSSESTPFTKKSLRTVCSDIANESLKCDVTKTMETFRDMIARDSRFVFTCQLDDDNRINALMWSSGRSRSLYDHFGDAITFDTTFGTNIYKMPFGMFVGVNNHFQSVIFAGVLLTNETALSFNWVFAEFVAMMGGKPPVTILTDQCKAMTIAIRETLKKTKHRWCKWHILRKAQEVLGNVYRTHKDFADEFNKVLHHMLTMDEFELAWSALLSKFNLAKNPFLIRVYQCRKKWAKPFFKDVFCARMTSTQRSESANHVLKIYVPPKSSIHQFIKQYTKMIVEQENNDSEAEKNNKQRKIKLTFHYPIERHASEIYTQAVYSHFLKELLKTSSYVVTNYLPGEFFEVTHVDAEKREVWCRVVFTITIQEGGTYYKCECGLYEHFGILCCHALKGLIQMGVCKIPEAHIMKRWTKNARSPHKANGAVGFSCDDLSYNRSLRQKRLYMAAIDMVRKGEEDDVMCEIALRNIAKANTEMGAFKKTKTTTCQVGYRSCHSDGYDENINSFTSGSSDTDGGGIHIRDPRKNIMIPVGSIKAPIIRRTAGRTKVKRFKSRLDGNISKDKSVYLDVAKSLEPGGRTGVHQSRFCSVCKSPDHDIRKCTEKAKLRAPHEILDDDCAALL